MHHPNYDHEGSHDLSCTFQEMATTTGLMGSELHEAQEVWTGQKGLQAAHCTAKGSPKGIQFFWVVPPTKLPKIMELRIIHFPEALCRWVGLSFCLWFGKEGQSEGTVVNHLWMSHYHLGLICSQCLKYCTTSTNAMHCHHWQWWPRGEIWHWWWWQGWLCIQLRLAPPHQAPTAGNQDVVTTLPHCLCQGGLPLLATSTLTCFTTKCSGAYCPLSGQHNCSGFSQYFRSFIISKVPYLTW